LLGISAFMFGASFTVMANDAPGWLVVAGLPCVLLAVAMALYAFRYLGIEIDAFAPDYETTGRLKGWRLRVLHWVLQGVGLVIFSSLVHVLTGFVFDAQLASLTSMIEADIGAAPDHGSDNAN